MPTTMNVSLSRGTILIAAQQSFSLFQSGFKTEKVDLEINIVEKRERKKTSYKENKKK